ncbi:MAG: amino acid ABC transporter substrate-binding protein, partial [Candidatus Electrothrix sp. EH2]|nr:amino acid ABC transporter substrate-binding protein [Candidatus Electrothrix sp. EH2]
MSGTAQEEGQAMLRGAKLACKRIKRERKILKNKKIEIIPYDDTNSQAAVGIASDIVNEDKVLCVLGHYSSSSSALAGSMYKSNGIPAITASAAVDSVTQKNELFFRTILGDRTAIKFIIHGMQELPGISSKTTASMIYDADLYNTTIEEFRKTAENIFDPLKIWSFHGDSDAKQDDLKKIIAEIRAEESVGPIFFATGSRDCRYLISGFRYPGTNYPIIGLESLSVPSFIRQEQPENGGYSTDGTYALSPFISYLADQPEALAFRKEFRRQYSKEPTWLAAAYYDAMLVALNAAEPAE